MYTMHSQYSNGYWSIIVEFSFPNIPELILTNYAQEHRQANSGYVLDQTKARVSEGDSRYWR